MLCSVSGREVSQLEAPFSEASSIALLRRSQNCGLRSEAVDRVAELLSWWALFLRFDYLAIASFGNVRLLERMRSIKGSVMLSKVANSLSEVLAGLETAMPPCRAGRTSKSRSRSRIAAHH